MSTKLKELIEDETTAPELSHGDSTPPNPPDPPDDNDDDDDDEEDFFDDFNEDELELEFVKEENKQLFRHNRLKLNVYQAETERLGNLQDIKESFAVEPSFYNPRYTQIVPVLSMNVQQARERCIIATYNAITRIVEKDITLEESCDEKDS